MKELALNENALGFSISGAGPSMFALCQSTMIAEAVAEQAKKLYKDKGIEINCYNSEINIHGAYRY